MARPYGAWSANHLASGRPNQSRGAANTYGTTNAGRSRDRSPRIDVSRSVDDSDNERGTHDPLLLVISQLTKTSARWFHPRLAKRDRHINCCRLMPPYDFLRGYPPELHQPLAVQTL